MDLIIKPTQRCNFSCTFCSSTEIAESNATSSDLSVSKIIQFLERFPDTKSIIVNGGDPLMVPPSFYFEIIEYLNAKDLPAHLDFCTNLWGYYQNRNKWRSLFENDRVSIGTSFDFDERYITPSRQLTVDLFIEILECFKSDFGYTPSFVSVITRENRWRAIDLVRLAKHLDVECKLNYLVASGLSKDCLTKGEAYQVYLEIVNAGLASYEVNSRQLNETISGANSCCPVNRNCDDGIRVLQPKREGYEYSSCGAFGDDLQYGIDFNEEMNGEKQLPLQNAVELKMLKEECLPCENFSLCNGCYKSIYDIKRLNLVEKNCIAMKKFRSDFKDQEK